jgi:RNA polymerase sigma factor (sigma-70 family)
MESLTQKILRYQRTHEGLRDLVNEIAPRVYQFPRRTMGWDEDACGDFYVFVHPRLVRLMERFRDQGKPFESYLWAVLGWQMRSFARERRRSERSWHVSLRIEQGDLVAPDPNDKPGCGTGCGADDLRAFSRLGSSISSGADRRNFLFLVLKCSRSLDEEIARPLASIAGITPEALLTLAAALRDMRRSREQRLETLRCRRNKAFSQIRLLEAELHAETASERIAQLTRTLQRARSTMQSTASRMASVGISPTNLEIARILGIPKGTVDSGLYWLKKKLASVYDPDSLRTA